MRALILFAPSPTVPGREQLTEDGRARLDSAMGPFIRYPRNTPFVIEGYAGGGTADVQFVLSRTRAQLVRDYLIAKFGLDATYVGTMPMGAEAAESPSGERWEGVALAMFAPR